jgi:glycosyl hydrolase family 15
MTQRKFVLIVVDRDTGEFTVEGPMSDDRRWNTAVRAAFWLVDNYVLCGRHAEAGELFERLISHCNDVGLLAEEFDPVTGRIIGNFPQAFSHTSWINSAINLSRQTRPAEERATSARHAAKGCSVGRHCPALSAALLTAKGPKLGGESRIRPDH